MMEEINSLQEVKKFKVNKYITLKIENEKTEIYIAGEKFLHCKKIAINVPVNESVQKTLNEIKIGLRKIDSIDDIEEAGLIDFPENDLEREELPEKVKFFVHCSNIQKFVEDGYDTRLLHSNLAFPLLKKLTDVGDPIARRVFKEEIAKRYNEGNRVTRKYLKNNEYLTYLERDDFLTMINETRDDLLELERIIKPDYLDVDVKAGKIVMLGVSKSDFHKGIPRVLFNFKSLKKLKLSYNKIETIPLELLKLKKLEFLSLAGNNLKKLPEWIWRLISLNHLDLYNCQLKQLPESLGLLSSLQSLKLDENQLRLLPESLGGLSSLKTLTIQKNHLERLPENLNSLNSLNKLLLSHNKIADLPGSLSLLSSLEILGLENNLLKGLPEMFGDFSRLKRLNLKNNKLESSFLRDVKNLKSTLVDLDISQNNFFQIPKIIKELKALQLLDIQKNPIEEIPDFIFNLKKLRIVYVKKGQIKNEKKIEEKFKKMGKEICFLLD